MIAIVNYQRGNLDNVLRAFQSFGFKTVIVSTPEDLSGFSGVVLPGVGAFKDAMETLRETGFDTAIKAYVASGKPFMGICLGLQLLFEEGLEFGRHPGLGILKGSVVPFKIEEKVPHMGWNQVHFAKPSKILKEVIQDGDYLYFVHSFYVKPSDESIVLTRTHYGVDFVSAIEQDNIFACQFHPEKSQETGLKIIKAFGEYCVGDSGN
ncbi:MAG: imidazole glycerol phosphate synthase subunit HisH [Spirochaetae bacterium HGW-Spirochaetae-6]|nr:MAG: imidazole glycerol phosphate synthase subunit HisH [Spirochaetae bacterium HGW-Spirochaetae-6]